MQLAPGVADQLDQAPLDREMDVFVGNIEVEAGRPSISFSMVREPPTICTHFAALSRSDLRQHLRMRDRAANVMAKEPPIERQRRGERLDLGQTAARESSANEIARSVADALWRLRSGDALSR